jgi:hypothetical protein
MLVLRTSSGCVRRDATAPANTTDSEEVGSSFFYEFIILNIIVEGCSEYEVFYIGAKMDWAVGEGLWAMGGIFFVAKLGGAVSANKSGA